MCSTKGPRGFSLIEVLVAFAILCLSVSVILQSYSSALRGVALAADYSRATLLAESLLAGVGGDLPLLAGEHQGNDSEGLSWRVTLSPYVDPLPLQVESPGVRLRLVVEVWWSGGADARQVRLTSLRYLPPPTRSRGGRRSPSGRG